jgi:hypothetical protein
MYHHKTSVSVWRQRNGQHDHPALRTRLVPEENPSASVPCTLAELNDPVFSMPRCITLTNVVVVHVRTAAIHHNHYEPRSVVLSDGRCDIALLCYAHVRDGTAEAPPRCAPALRPGNCLTIEGLGHEAVNGQRWSHTNCKLFRRLRQIDSTHFYPQPWSYPSPMPVQPCLYRDVPFLKRLVCLEHELRFRGLYRQPSMRVPADSVGTLSAMALPADVWSLLLDRCSLVDLWVLARCCRVLRKRVHARLLPRLPVLQQHSYWQRWTAEAVLARTLECCMFCMRAGKVMGRSNGTLYAPARICRPCEKHGMCEYVTKLPRSLHGMEWSLNARTLRTLEEDLAIEYNERHRVAGSPWVQLTMGRPPVSAPLYYKWQLQTLLQQQQPALTNERHFITKKPRKH